MLFIAAELHVLKRLSFGLLVGQPIVIDLHSTEGWRYRCERDLRDLLLGEGENMDERQESEACWS